MKRSGGIRPLNSHDQKEFVSLMATAFAEDPLFLTLLPASKCRKKAAAALAGFVFAQGICTNADSWGRFENGELIGAYLMSKPVPPAAWNLLKGLPALTTSFIKLLIEFSFSGIKKLNQYYIVTRKTISDDPCHYLVKVGVKPEQQGKGIGAELIQHAIKRCTSCSLSIGIALDTENECNILFYERLGFQQIHTLQLGKLDVYCFFYRL